MIIEVHCDAEKVFEGTREQFLTNNDHDSFLTNILNGLDTVTKVEFQEHSGHWEVFKRDGTTNV